MTDFHGRLAQAFSALERGEEHEFMITFLDKSGNKLVIHHGFANELRKFENATALPDALVEEQIKWAKDWANQPDPPVAERIEVSEGDRLLLKTLPIVGQAMEINATVGFQNNKLVQDVERYLDAKGLKPDRFRFFVAQILDAHSARAAYLTLGGVWVEDHSLAHPFESRDEALAVIQMLQSRRAEQEVQRYGQVTPHFAPSYIVRYMRLIHEEWERHPRLKVLDIVASLKGMKLLS